MIVKAAESKMGPFCRYMCMVTRRLDEEIFNGLTAGPNGHVVRPMGSLLTQIIIHRLRIVGYI